jgi:long-chain acyl-CoA synthetase
MLIHNFLENSAAQHPNKIAVIHDDTRATYKQLNDQSTSLANYLLFNGIAKGDRIALLLENNLEYIAAYYAALKAGAVAAPLNPGLKPDGLQYLLQDLEPAAIITSFKSERLLKNVPLSDLPNLKLLIIKTPKQKWNTEPYKVSTLEETLSNPTNFQPVKFPSGRSEANFTGPMNPTNPRNPIDLGTQ